MKFRILTFLIGVSFPFFCCSPILKTISGIKDIRIETTNDLKDFCLKTGIELNDSYYYQAENQFEIPDSSQINFQFADQVLIFNRDGNRIIYNGGETGNYCSLPGSDFFSGLNSIFLPTDTINTLKHILSGYRNIQSDNVASIDTANYYLVYFWAKWYRKLSKNSIEDIRPILSNANDSISIQSFYLNIDFVSINYPSDVDFKKLKINVSL